MDLSLLESIGLSKSMFDDKIILAQQIELVADTTVFKSGDPCGAFLILIRGQLRVDVTTKSGKEVTLYRMQERDTCIITTSVLLNQEDYYAQAVTETDITALAIPTDDFHKALKYSKEFSHYILTDYARRISALIRLLDRIASKDILFDLNSLLLQRIESSGFVHIKHDELAKEIGTAREVISRKLAELETEGGLITHRGKIEIINRTYLENILRA